MKLTRMFALATASLLLATFLVLPPGGARAQDAGAIEITVKDHRFDPAEIKAPAGKAVTLHVKNLDPTPIEFESRALRVEKIIPGNGEARIGLRAQKAGRYKFFDDYNESSAQGVLVVE